MFAGAGSSQLTRVHYYSSSKKTSALRVITLPALPSDKQKLCESLLKREDLCSTNYSSRAHTSGRSDVEPAVNRQPDFRRELVEQNQHLHLIIDIPAFGCIQSGISKWE